MSDVSPSISNTTFAARRKAVKSGGEKDVGGCSDGARVNSLTCGVHREKIIFG